MNELPDGRYDVIIIDAENIDANTMRVEFAFTSGDVKGDVVALRGPLLASDPMSILGLPATLFVVDGAPRLALDDA